MFANVFVKLLVNNIFNLYIVGISPNHLFLLYGRFHNIRFEEKHNHFIFFFFFLHPTFFVILNLLFLFYIAGL